MTMKKYIIPKATCINLAGEETLLLTGSINTDAEDVDVMTREQYIESPWDDWSE